MKKIFITLFIFFYASGFSQSKPKPKLVVGIVVDQMRYDYIYRFWDEFSEDGFKRLVNQGHFFRNANFSYVPTFTGPGHASIFTGTTPSIHGIISNSWFDKTSGKSIYCAGDGNTRTVCNCDANQKTIIDVDGQMSPHHMLTTTIGDEMQLFDSSTKVIGISLKDRGAILSAGHSADAAYWMNSGGEWITSSFYMEDLPEWMKKYQDNNSVSRYMKGEWRVQGLFNYDLESMYRTKGGAAIKSTPFGNTILNDLAIKILKEEELGKRDPSDFLAISFSSTDYIGHAHGPHSAEIKDTYIKLDQEISKLLQILDKRIGYDNLLVFLTADHGVVSEPHQLIEKKIPAGYFDKTACKESLNNYLIAKYGEGDWIRSFSNLQFFLNHELITSNNLQLWHVQQECAGFLISLEGIKNTFTAMQMHQNEYLHSSHSLIQRGYNQKRSGDVIIVLEPGWIDKSWESGGTTHGASYSYDTHVPLIFWGGIVETGVTDRLVNIVDIAPTVSTFLGISFPNGCVGNPIIEITQ